MHAFWETVASNSLLVAVLALGVALLGRVWKNPVGLHLLWVLVLLKLLAPPVVTIPVAWSLLGPSHTLIASEATPSLTSATSGEPSGQASTRPAVRGDPLTIVEDRKSPPPLVANHPVLPAVVEPWRLPWLVVLAWAWGTGTAWFAARRACRIVRFRRLLREAEVPSFAVLCMAEDLGRQLGLKKLPDIRMLPLCLSPLVWSLGGRARVYLPTALFERLDEAAQEAILAHELAHVRRKDHWVRLMELVVTTLFWWHPVVWWACRELQELEDQCCDGLVMSTTPHGARTYAMALLDTLDFLSERPVAVPLGATAAKSSVLLARRIEMLKDPVPVMRLALGRLALLMLIAALPMAIAFAAETTKTDKPAAAAGQKSDEPPAIQRRAINKRVADFPEKTDLSTPESAFAAYERAWAHRDAKAVLELSWYAFTEREVQDTQRFMDRDAGKDPAAYRDALLQTEIVEVAIYRDAMAEVISKLHNSPQGTGSRPYSGRTFGKINGVWKNLGETRLPSREAARESFDRKKDSLWQNYVNVRESIKKGKPLSFGDERPKRSAMIAPGESLGISVEKADLMGRVEWVLMHGGRDITARKTIEWSDVEKDADGNRKIRYKFYATIWDKDVYIANEVFTFDAKGNLLDVADVKGFPQKKVEKPVNVDTQEGMKELVEGFFSQNYRDITSRETIEWGDPVKEANGDVSIRYKYRARIWNKATKINNEIFTFDPKGKFVSVKKIEQPVNTSTQEGLQELVEDFLCKNFRDVTSRDVIDWGDVTKEDNGNVSIRHKYRARIWDKETKIMNQVFTFDPKGKFVSVKHVDGFPQNP